jgi:transposase-like protein
MGMQRNQHSAELKTRVSVEAIKERKTLNEIASEYPVHPGQVSKWKKHLVDNIGGLFSTKKELVQKQDQAMVDSLYQQIGQQKVEIDWLKKKTGFIH